MRKIPMLDLNSEVESLRESLEEAIGAVMASTLFINGPEVGKLEEELAEYLNVRHVISCGNGTDALLIALMAAGLKPGDGVITSPFTFFATAEVIAFLGLEVQFADIMLDTYNMDPDAVERNIIKNTKAIMPVHLFGQTAQMSRLQEIALQKNLLIIEDSAQATGGRYKRGEVVYQNGTIGDMGCTSFFPSKNLGCYGDGGAIFTQDNVLAEKCRMIKNHGSRIKYINEIIGVNSRLDTLQAAILRVKLQHLDRYNLARKNIAEKYDKAFLDIEGLVIPYVREGVEHVYHQYTLRVRNGKRDALQRYLTEAGISTAVYYKTPLHLQKALKRYGYKTGDFPVAECAANAVLSLPIHPYLKAGEQNYIIDKVIAFFER